jgi:hypothetical protein
VASDGASGDDFGWSVAYDGERAAVGAPNGWAAYVYGPASLPVAIEPPATPSAAAVLSVPRPNPFRDRTTLAIHLDQAQEVEVALYDVLGRRVRHVRSGPLSAGAHLLHVAGADLVPGLYVLHVTGEGFALTQRLVRVR